MISEPAWQYRVLDLYIQSNAEHSLNQLGAGGWEIVSVNYPYQTEPTRALVILKCIDREMQAKRYAEQLRHDVEREIQRQIDLAAMK